MTDTILDYFTAHKGEVVTREQLVIATGINDRTVRDAIKRLREDGVPIVNGDKGKGYKLTDEPQEIDRLIKKHKSYIKEHYKTIRKLTKQRYTEDGIRFTTVREHERKIV